MSTNNRMVSIVDDDIDIVMLFRDALQGAQELHYLLLRILSWHWNTFILMNMHM